MFCKYCGKEIDEDSKFCRYCGGELQSVSTETLSPENKDSKVNLEVEGEIKAVISPNLPKFTKLKAFLNKHNVYCTIAAIWFIINCIFLSIGDDHKHFWPHIYSHSEVIWDHDTLEYNPFTNSYYNGKVGHNGPEETIVDWDLCYYGLTEFLVYAVLIPIIAFFIYNAILERTKTKNNSSYRFSPSEGLRKD